MSRSSAALHPPPSTLLLCQTEHVSRRSWHSRFATDTSTCTSSSRATSLAATEVGSFSTLARWERRIEVCFLRPCGRTVPREERLLRRRPGARQDTQEPGCCVSACSLRRLTPVEAYSLRNRVHGVLLRC